MSDKLVLVHVRPGSGTDACVPGVHVDCIAAGTPHCHALVEPYKAPIVFEPLKIFLKYFTSIEVYPLRSRQVFIERYQIYRKLRYDI